MNSRRGRCTLATLAGLTEDQAAARGSVTVRCHVSAPDEMPFFYHRLLLCSGAWPFSASTL
jgi:hypothetical protein